MCVLGFGEPVTLSRRLPPGSDGLVSGVFVLQSGEAPAAASLRALNTAEEKPQQQDVAEYSTQTSISN